jgi:hypothetical protein
MRSWRTDPARIHHLNGGLCQGCVELRLGVPGFDAKGFREIVQMANDGRVIFGRSALPRTNPPGERTQLVGGCFHWIDTRESRNLRFVVLRAREE